MVVPLSAIPPSRDGFYAINNQFLANGPKGFQELKTLESDDMFIRMDFPGVPEDGMKVEVDPTKKAVTVFALASKEHKHDSSPRNYVYTTGLVCKCCEISAVAAHMSDGVLRLLLSKTLIATQRPLVVKDHCWTGSHKLPYGTDPHGICMLPNSSEYRRKKLFPTIPTKSVVRNISSEKKSRRKRVRISDDVPTDSDGQNSDEIATAALTICIGKSSEISDDSVFLRNSSEISDEILGNKFRKKLQCFLVVSTPIDIPIRQIKIISKNGVIRLIIPPA
ncbi:hypothetical protein N665_0799s0003 [Sinapis alba]|nr:hypothetical protein N665_0799s0003 [Sinapis alba]